MPTGGREQQLARELAATAGDAGAGGPGEEAAALRGPPGGARLAQVSGRLAASVSSSAEWARHHFSSARLSEGSHDEGTHVRGVSQQRGSFRCRAGLVERLFWGGGGFGRGQPAWVNCQVIVPSVRPTWSLQRTPTWARPGTRRDASRRSVGGLRGAPGPKDPGNPHRGGHQAPG